MKRIATLTFFLFLITAIIRQLPAQLPGNEFRNLESMEMPYSLTKQDSILASKIPELTLPDPYRERMGRDLPAVVNNAKLPFMRPVFSQTNYANCGQSSAIGYNYTYEINRARGTRADTESNQYTPQFSWNFMNGGDGWYGVSYFHSFDILKKVGNPSVADYGGMFYGGSERWMSGYESYHNTILNRIEEVYSINIGTIEGINTLKYWLFDHLEGDTCGGLASFYSYSAWNYTFLPEGTPEGGKHVIKEWHSPATHAMTIVGYNDSIRYDYNNDGKYTNDIDINEDGVVDLKDWEKGGFLFVNSHGDHWADSGFCYAMYNSFAYPYEENGIWNQSVNVLKVKPDYQPLLGMKLKLRHNSRNKLKIIAGVSADTNLRFPEHTIDFPIVNYQGGNKVLQGSDTIPAGDELELELDITPLLSFVEPGDWSRYFLRVIERDARKEGDGEVLYYSLFDYLQESEMICQHTPLEITNNGITSVPLDGQIMFDKLQILTEELPAVNPEAPYSVQLEADGGVQPYKWLLLKSYRIDHSDEIFPSITGQEIEFSNNETAYARVDLPFAFPFYDDTVHQIYIHVDGFVTFEKTDLPYPYFMGEPTMLKNQKMIAPFLCDLQLLSEFGHNVTFRSTDDYFLVSWEATPVQISNVVNLVFALKIFPSGEFVTYFDEMDVPDGVLWSSGVSLGDEINYQFNHVEFPLAGLNHQSYRYTPQIIDATSMSVSSDGLFEINGLKDGHIYASTLMVEDDRNICAMKEFQISSGVTVRYEISSGYDETIQFGETASLSAMVKNISPDTINNIKLNYAVEDEYLTILHSNGNIGMILPGESVLIDSSLVLGVAVNIPDQHSFVASDTIKAEGREWLLDTWLIADAPDFKVKAVESNGHPWIDPGLENQVDFRILNAGHAAAQGIDVEIHFENDSVELIGSPGQSIDFMRPGDVTTISYIVKPSPSMPSGTKIFCTLTYYMDHSVISIDTLWIQVGRTPVLLVDMDPNHLSVQQLREDLEATNTSYESVSWIPDNLSGYRSVFVLLGSIFENHELSDSEGEDLSDYLNQGGNLYMEGRVTWKQQPTPVHDKFGTEITQDFIMFAIDTVFSQPSDTIPQMKYAYASARPYNDYVFLPNDSTFQLMSFRINDSACVVGRETDNYRTIASIIEYGALVSSDTSSGTTNYMNSIIDFFKLKENTVGYDEYRLFSPEHSNVKVFPNPFKKGLTIQIGLTKPEEITLQIFSQSGQLVYHREIKGYLGSEQPVEIKWNGTDLNGNTSPKGIYLIRVSSGNRNYTTKVIRL